METKKDYSYGVIPVFKDDISWKVFLIHQYGSKGDVYWTFPKGHPEEGESPEETARRELKEETGIVLKELDTHSTFAQSYSFQCEDLLIDKSVVYYLGFASSKDFTIQEDEIKEAGWFTVASAREKLTHDMAKNMFDMVALEIQKLSAED